MSGARPTVVRAIRGHALERPDARAFTFLRDGEQETAAATFGELDRRARALAAELVGRGAAGERALLLYPSGLDFAVAFLACLYAGVVACPGAVGMGSAARTLERLRNVIADAEPAVALVDAARRDEFETELHALGDVEVLTEMPDAETDWEPSEPDRTALALLQYTSGSTSRPKGVMVTHENLVVNQGVLEALFGGASHNLSVSWLPLFHDMGLLWGLLYPLWLGTHAVLMPPEAFLKRPIRWLRAIGHYGARVSGAPNFAYELCIRSTTPEQRDGLDLSSWRVAFNASEPVRASTLERFADAFREHGFDPDALDPAYGLAEATLAVSGGFWDGTVTCELEGRTVVGVGKPRLGTRVAIADPATREELPAGELGEIWYAGGNVAAGYWRRKSESEETFRAFLADGSGPFLRTGDLGFVDAGGELFIAGRLKDLLIVRGTNHYPQDIEETAERAHEALRPGSGVAFTVDGDDGEQLVIVHEIAKGYRPEQLPEIVASVRRAVAEGHGLRLHALTLIRRIPKTSSGKLQRRLCRQLFLEGRLEPRGEWREQTATAPTVA